MRRCTRPRLWIQRLLLLPLLLFPAGCGARAESGATGGAAPTTVLARAEDLAARWGQARCAPGAEERRFVSCTTPGQGAPAFLAGPTAAGPTDLRGHFVELRLRVEGVAHLRGIELRLISGDPQAFFAFPIPLFADPHFNVLQDGAWTPYTLSFGTVRVEGAPDRAAIDGVGLYVQDDGEAPVRIDWAGLFAVPQPPTGIVSFTFDDGLREHASFAAPEMARFGFRGTAYVMPSVIGGPDFLSPTQLEELGRDYGWDVAAHHGKPFTDFPPEQLEAEILGVQHYLREHGFERGAEHLAYPLGKQDPVTVRPLVNAHFATARVASAGPETLPPGDPHLLRALNVLGTTSPEELGRIAARARDNGEWAILMFHHLVDEPRGELYYAKRDFRAALAQIAATGVEVLPVSEVWERLTAGGAPAAPPPR